MYNISQIWEVTIIVHWFVTSLVIFKFAQLILMTNCKFDEFHSSTSITFVTPDGQARCDKISFTWISDIWLPPRRSEMRWIFMEKNALEGNEHLASRSPDCYRYCYFYDNIVLRLSIPFQTAARLQILINVAELWFANRYYTWRIISSIDYFKELSSFSFFFFVIVKGSPVAYRCSRTFFVWRYRFIIIYYSINFANDAIPFFYRYARRSNYGY